MNKKTTALTVVGIAICLATGFIIGSLWVNLRGSQTEKLRAERAAQLFRLNGAVMKRVGAHVNKTGSLPQSLDDIDMSFLTEKDATLLKTGDLTLLWWERSREREDLSFYVLAYSNSQASLEFSNAKLPR